LTARANLWTRWGRCADANTGRSMRRSAWALARVPIREPLKCGIRAVDAFLTCGRGQRVGIFGGSGVGKSTLIGMMARNTGLTSPSSGWWVSAAVKCATFWRLWEWEGCRRSCVVVSTSDSISAVAHSRGAGGDGGGGIFLRPGRQVLLVVDSLTRFGHGAARDRFGGGRTADGGKGTRLPASPCWRA